jgi:hypothetical protein
MEMHGIRLIDKVWVMCVTESFEGKQAAKASRGTAASQRSHRRNLSNVPVAICRSPEKTKSSCPI